MVLPYYCTAVHMNGSLHLQSAEDAVRQALLRPQPPGAERGQPRELAEAQNDAAGRHVRNVAPPVEGQQRRLAGGREFDVPDLSTVLRVQEDSCSRHGISQMHSDPAGLRLRRLRIWQETGKLKGAPVQCCCHHPRWTAR